MRAITLTSLVALALTMTAAFAHHSVPVNFDQTREITIEGVEWLVEMGAINTMRRSGFRTDLFVVGNPVSITGWPGRRDRVIHLNQALLHDGTELICAGQRCGPTADEQ